MRSDHQPRPDSRGDRLGQRDIEVERAMRFVAVLTAAGMTFLLVALVWSRSCGDALDTAACGAPYRTVLAMGAPVILAGGGLRAFWHTYLVWRDRGTWWGWQGAGWLLFSLMVFTMIVTADPIIGPALRR